MRLFAAALVTFALAAGVGRAQDLPQMYAPILAQASALTQFECPGTSNEGGACFMSRYDENGTRDQLELVFIGSPARWQAPWAQQGDFLMRAFTVGEEWHAVSLSTFDGMVIVFIHPFPAAP